MAQAVGLTLNTSFLANLEKADKLYDELIKKENALSKATVKAFETMTQQGVVPYVEQLQKQKQALEGVAKVRLGKNATQEMRDMKANAKDAVKEINKLITSLQKTSQYKGEISGASAISFSKDILSSKDNKSINNMRLALAELEKAQGRVNLATKEGQKQYKDIGKEIKNVQKELDRVEGKNKQLTNSTKSLGGAISTAFAAQALRGFINNLIKVRGEFEMQHRSLQILLQDVDKANELWDKTVALAVKSPFRVKELVTYTKQLAAYRVESDKLYDTTRMLADVSAGLGVDMNRLILAFGQVKAANFLRGTELRQFSEAGVNMLEELAKRFTALEGRAVSVGDVFERVSKRMVSFKDVEAVFQTITSEGGVFYQMQEKQSETLRGLIMNLKDSIDLMFNEIGQDNESTLKGAVGLAKKLVDNWRQVYPLIKDAGIALMAYFAVSKLVAIGKAMASLLTPWGAIAAGIGAAIYAIIRMKSATSELAAAMNQVDVNITKQLEESIVLYRKLADEVRDVTKSEYDRDKALKQLQSRFDDILPSQLLELDYIKGISDNYKGATEAMINYYNAKAIEQKKDRVENLYAEDMTTGITDLVSAIKRRIETRRDVSDSLKPILRSGVSKVISDIIEDIKNGALSADFDTVSDEIQKRLEKWANTTLPRTQAGEGMFRVSALKDIIGTMQEYTTVLGSIQGLPYNTFEQMEASRLFLPEKKNIEDTTTAFKKLLALLKEFSSLDVSQWGTTENNLEGRIDTIMKELPEQAAAYIPHLQTMVEKMKNLASKGAFEFAATMQNLQQEFTVGLSDIIFGNLSSEMSSVVVDEATGEAELVIKEELRQLVTNFQETLDKEAKSLELTAFQKSVEGVFRDVAKATDGVDVDLFARFVPYGKKARGEIIKELIALKEQYEQQVKEWNKSIEKGESEARAEQIHQITKAQIEQMKKDAPALLAAAERLGYIEKGKKKKDNTIEEKIKVVDQMNAKFKEINQYAPAAEAIAGAFDAYKDAFAVAYKREDVKTMTAQQFVSKVLNFPNEDDVIKWLDNLASQVTDFEDKFKVEIAKGKFEMDVEVRAYEAKNKKIVEDVQRIFDQYDSTIELKKLKIPEDFAKKAFNLDYINLDELRDGVIKKFAEGAGKGSEQLTNLINKKFSDIQWDKVTALVGKGQMEKIRESLKEITELQDKELEESAKRFAKFLTKNLDQTKVILEQKGIDVGYAKKMFDEGKISAEGFADVVKNIVTETNEEISKINLELFKESPQYIQAMGDMTAYSAQEIRELIKSLEDMIAANSSAFSAEEAKAYINAIYNAQERLDELEKMPFDWGSWEKIGDILQTEKDIEEQKKKKEDYRNTEATQLEELAVLEEKLLRLEEERELLKANGADKAALDYNQSQIDDTVNAIQKGQEAVASTRNQAKVTEATIGKLGDKLKGLVGKAGSTVAIIDAIVNGINDTVQGMKEITNEIGSVMESFGADTDMSTGFGQFSKAFDIFAESSQHAADGWNALKSGDPVGAVVSIVKSVTSIIKGINEFNDAQIEVNIEKNLKEVENLKKEYERLEWAIERAFAFDRYGMVADKTENLGKQIKKLQDSISLEEDKKNTDEERIGELKADIENASREIQDLFDNLREEIVGSYEDVASTLADAMINALKNGEDALKAWGDSVDEIIANIVTKLTVQKYLEPKIADALDEYYGKTMPKTQAAEKAYQKYLNALETGSKQQQESALKEWSKLNEAAIGELPNLTQQAVLELEKDLNDLGLFFRPFAEQIAGLFGSNGAGLTALQKGIQGITEAQAEVIEAYLNSIRQIASDNLMYVRNIANLLEGVSSSGHSKGGRGIKVFMS